MAEPLHLSTAGDPEKAPAHHTLNQTGRDTMKQHEKPVVTLHPEARHAYPTELIADFQVPNGDGGLVSFTAERDGSVTVDFRGCSAGVRITLDGKPVERVERGGFWYRLRRLFED